MKHSFHLLRSLFGTRRRRHRGGRRPIQKSTLGRFETLESRHLLTSHALATVTGVVGTGEAEVALSVADNTEPVVLGIMIASGEGSPLDPLAPRVVRLVTDNTPTTPVTEEVAVTPVQSADNHNGTTSGYATVQLEAGDYKIYVGGETDTAGEFVLDVTIPGDLGQDGVVGQDELQWTTAAMLQQQDWGNHFSARMFRGLGIDPTIDLYRAEVDANGDGTIDGFDVVQVTQNSKSGTVTVVATADQGIQARLEQARDTGRSDSDGITNDTDASIVGTISNVSAVASLTGQIDDGNEEDLFALFGTDFVVDGAFALNLDDLATIAGGAAADLIDSGGHTLTLRALDGADNALQDPVEVTFEFDTIAPDAPSTPDLVAASDSGASDTDDVTNINTPAFEVDHVDANVLVRLFSDLSQDPLGEATTASPVTITSTQLDDGDHQITATGTDVAGNESDASAALAVTIDTASPTATDNAYDVDENGNPASGNAVTDDAGGGVDSDADSPPVTFVSFDLTNTTGTVTDNGNGDFTYDPNGQFESLALGATGTDTFGYTIEDGAGNQTTGTVTITINGENDTPVAADVAVNANKNDASVNRSFDADDVDSDDAPGDLVYTITSSPAEGSVTNNDDGTFTFLPGTDFQDLTEGQSRQVSFTYTAEDSHGAVSDPATVTVTVAGFNNAPTFAEIETVTLKAGSPLHIPLDGFDLEGQALTYAVTANTNSALVATSLPETASRGMRITVDGFAENPSDDGEMVFRLFEQRVPDITDRMIEVAEAGSYNGSTFHRVIDAFVIQGGIVADGSSYAQIDDQYHPDAQHNRTGTLSTAKSDDDTNTTQFFVMEINPAVDSDSEGKARRLDFNHSVFGVQIEGEDVRERISNVATASGDAPQTPVVIQSVEIFTDTENDLLMLKAAEGASGTADITVTVTDSQGKSFSRTFRVNVEPDDFNGAPFLDPIPEIRTTVDTPVEFTLTSIDVEGDPVFYDGFAITTDAQISINNTTGVVTATPPPGATGSFEILVGVRAADGFEADTVDAFDRQTLTIFID